MNTSIEITLMPLNDDYKSIIKKFIMSVRDSNFQILENPLSTQIYGDFEPMMKMLVEKINSIFSNCDGIMVNLKIVKGNRFWQGDESYNPEKDPIYKKLITILNGYK